MGVPKKRRRKMVRNGKTFWWCVKPNDDTYLYTFTDDDNLLLSIVSDDKNFIVSYHLNQKNEKSKIKNPYIITEGKEFKGLEYRGRYERYIVPEWNVEVITPSLVAQIIDWCFVVEDVTAVDYLGNILDNQDKA